MKINRDKAATLGITANQIESTLYNAYGSRQVSTIYTPANQYYVILEVAPELSAGPRRALAALPALAHPASSSRSMPSRRSRRTVGPLTVTHLGQLPVGHDFLRLAPGVSLGDAVTQIEDAVRGSSCPTA